MTKYGFRIRTRVGLVVDNLLIHGRDEGDAERKLRQMYHGCEIIECVPMFGAVRGLVANFEEVAALITR
ncbi:MAG: hypothetical protein A2045_16025 [Rhodocyclales bacterium GWA2_65_20]|nr:MAG: hypothetical protein A2045_16025 [Rhodocyclales bacterium GWA2_65_20]